MRVASCRFPLFLSIVKVSQQTKCPHSEIRECLEVCLKLEKHGSKMSGEKNGKQRGFVSFEWRVVEASDLCGDQSAVLSCL